MALYLKASVLKFAGAGCFTCADTASKLRQYPGVTRLLFDAHKSMIFTRHCFYPRWPAPAKRRA
jgi:hypothetical protein